MASRDDDRALSKGEIAAHKQIKKLIMLKERTFCQLQKVYDLSLKVNDPDCREMFLVRSAEIDEIRNRFEDIIQSIYDQECYIDVDAKLNFSELESFDEVYFQIKKCISKNKNIVSNEGTSKVPEARPRLPKIELFTFDGNIENFPTFLETFSSLVHDQPNISNIDKFHYLLSCTTGTPLNIVKSVPITSDNYEVVWNALLDKYKDQRILAGRYLDKMLNFIPIKRESSENLSKFLDVFDNSVKALKALNIDNLSSYILCHIALKALDRDTHRLFEQEIDQKTVPCYEQLMSFLHKHIKVLEHSTTHSFDTNNVNTSSFKYKEPIHNKNFHNKNYNKPFNTKSHSQFAENKISCLHCNKDHLIYRCESFRKLTPSQRISRANALTLCHNCLKTNHSTSQCNSKFKCFICQQSHHALLHTNQSTKTMARERTSCDNKTDQSSCNTSLSNDGNYNVILGTAVVYILDAFGKNHPCRVLIDSGAQSNFISRRCLQRLGLSTRKCSVNIFGLAGEHVRNYGVVSCEIKSRQDLNITFNIDAVVLHKLTSDLPNINVPKSVVNKYKNLVLADPEFHKCSPIDIILAGDIFPYIYHGERLIINSNLPVALNSVFGYVISGKLANTNSNKNIVHTSTSNLVSYTSDDDVISNYLHKFWEVESSPCDIPSDPLDKIAEDIYLTKHYRNSEGRYISPLLRNPMHPQLGDSYNSALKRFLQLERRLSRAPELYTAYINFMREYEQLGHMGVYSGSETKNYIPHHCVVRTNNSSTPVRVVFDGSAKTDNGISLNDLLLTGGNLHHDILKIILQFRLHKICFSADISKMYRQVLIDPSERCYQHILWRENPSDPIKTYELNTNTYGLRSAPFIAVRTLLQLATDEGARYPNASKLLREGFFVDDLLWSVNSEEEAYNIQQELISLLNLGGFTLHKWASSNNSLLNNLLPNKNINFNDDSSHKVLGLEWSPKNDCFCFKYSFIDTVNTKRSVLKLLASIFDPVGFIAPCTFIAKCILQDLWKLSIGWDDKIPSESKNKWVKFIDDLSQLSNLKIERHLLSHNFTYIQFIGFCDASSRGYGACIYAKSVNNIGESKVQLLVSKTKVAPLKPLSIPRLELMAAVLLSKLYLLIINNCKELKYETFALTDSSVVLAWLKTPPYRLKTFVSSRVSKVIELLPPLCWYHVNSENNAADICSRGAWPSQLVSCANNWFHGPSWLHDHVNKWPISQFYITNDSNILELKSNVDTFALLAQTELNNIENVFINFSCFNKLNRVIGWCYRFYNNCKLVKNKRNYSNLSFSELRAAHDVIIRVVQTIYFNSEIVDIRNKSCKNLQLKKLSPFIDCHGLLRVGGRLSQSNLSFNCKHPLLLPKKCHVTVLLIEYYHKKYLHVGPRTLHSILMKTYWIVSARSVIRSVLSKCVTCFRCKPVSVQPYMGELPSARVRPEKPFNHVGCDIGGPFYIKESLRKNAKIHKAYLCLFICFSTKAVHLEVLSDLTTDCFLAALDRFVSRRGLCSCIYSDCGTNFVAAAKHLNEVTQFLHSSNDVLYNECCNRHIEWKFNPPSAPHMGGLWEAGIKSAKYHLYRAIGDKGLTFEELSTTFCKIEAILNSRPLSHISDAPDECEVLTPGHFLTGQALLSVPEYNLQDINITKLTRWQYIQRTSQAFWRTWANDYLHTLQQRVKWHQSKDNIKIGDVVVIKSDLCKPLQWPLARVHQVHPGPDNHIRVVTLKTSKGFLKRPVNKICPLPKST